MKTAKRIIIPILLLSILIVSIAFAPVYASADSASSKSSYTPVHEGYILRTVLDGDGNVAGVRYSGFYFGGDINVTVDIYSSPSFVVDFYINDSAANYSEAQKLQRKKLIDLAEEIHEYINKVDSLANTQYDGTNKKPLSDIYRYNHYNAYASDSRLKIDEITYEMLLVAKEMYRETDGAFNPAVYRLVDLWGFSSRIYSNGNFGLPYDRPVTDTEFFKNGYPLPEQKYITAFSAPSFTDFSDSAVTLTQEGDDYYVTKNVMSANVDGTEYEQWLDLGGIAKGYVADGVKAKIRNIGADRFNVDCGSSSMVFGHNYDGGSNTMTIPDPFDPRSILGLGAMLSVEFGQASVSTSGQYIRKYTVDGVEYSHIIDGTKGAPAQTGVKLVSIIAPDDGDWAGKGDCLTTALTVMGQDRIIEFMNGYLKDNGIEIIVLYQSVDGSKQILSNMEPSAVKKISDNYDDYSWSVEQAEDGSFVYNGKSKQSSDFTWLIITLGVVVGLCVIGVIVYYFLRGKRSVIANIKLARKDKPFKLGDVGVYVAVVLVIAILFAVFFTGDNEQNIAVVKVLDMQTQEILFAYNVSRNEWTVNVDENGWTVKVEREGNDVIATFTKTIDGEEHYNVMKITRGSAASVKMTNSVCGFHQECVKNFPAITAPNGSIVCSPNRLKVITE